MRTPRLVAVFAFVFSLIVSLGVSPAEAASYNIYKGPNTSNKVILTFDDCPKSLSSFKKTVKAFRDMGVTVALFPTGNCIKSGKFDAKYARKMGHYVFNHTISHPNLAKRSYASIKKELGGPGVVSTYGRPPYGAYNSTVKKAYKDKGMKMWLWTVDTNDWRGKSSKQLVNYVVKNARKGDTVLMHMQWNGFNKSTVKQIKSGLNKKGIKLCKNYKKTVAAKPKTVKC